MRHLLLILMAGLCALFASPQMAKAAGDATTNPRWELFEAALAKEDYVEARRIAEADPKQAFAHFLAAAKLGDARALRYVGMARLNGEGVDKDPAAALADFKSAAVGGNVWAMIDIAVMLAVGEGVPADPPQAREWYAKAAEHGSAHALRGLGWMLYQGEGGARDPVRGRAYLELAAAAGDDRAPAAAALVFKLSPAERAAVDQVKTDWLRVHPAPEAD